MKALEAILTQVEKLEAVTKARLNVVSKAERDALVNASVQAGVFPSLDGMDRHQRAAVEAARRTG